MFNLTNNQLKYFAYAFMGVILVILLSNIFLTKINNNYNNSTFESFGNIKEGMENKNLSDDFKVIDSIYEDYCKNNKNTNEISKELPKLINIYSIIASDSYFNFYDKFYGVLDEKSEKSQEYRSFSNYIKLIEQLKIIEEGLKSFEFDCDKSHLNINKLNIMKNKGNSKSDSKLKSKSESDSKSWF